MVPSRSNKTALYLLETYGSAERMARMNSSSYEKLCSLSRGKFSPQQFLKLKQLAVNTVGVSNEILEAELTCLLSLYKSLEKQISSMEAQILTLINDIHPCYMSIPGIGPISAAVIYAEYGDKLIMQVPVFDCPADADTAAQIASADRFADEFVIKDKPACFAGNGAFSPIFDFQKELYKTSRIKFSEAN